MSGYRDGSFRPNEPVTRVQFLNMLWLVSGSPEAEGSTSFGDAPAWALDAIVWAVENEIVTGYPDGTFRPGDPITRAAASRMMFRASGV